MTVQGKLELIIKINELPVDVTVDKNGWKSFDLDCDGQIFNVTVNWTLEKIEAKNG